MKVKVSEDFEILGEHLSIVDPVFTKWCDSFGFARDYNRGRYPNRCYRRHSEVNAFIELAMQYNERGKPFTQFFPEIPYWFVLGINKMENGRRIILFRDMPFEEVKKNISIYLKKCEFLLKKYSLNYLLKSGEKFMMPFLEMN